MREQDSLVLMVLARLERVSADSALAHQASGVRGALLRALESSELGNDLESHAVERIMERAFTILEREAARYSPRSGATSGRT